MTRRQLLQYAALAALPAARSSAAIPFVLPDLPYPTNALDPYIDALTMEIHHGKHHRAYVDNLNSALARRPDVAAKPLEQLLANLSVVPPELRAVIRNHGGGHLNHSLFWRTLGKPGSVPTGKLQAAIARSFGTQSSLEDKLRAAGFSIFGSGWAWVVPDRGGLKIETSPNQDSPWMSGRAPLFGIDVWEHAYYLKYQNRRADYLNAITHVINWDFLSKRYEELVR